MQNGRYIKIKDKSKWLLYNNRIGSNGLPVPQGEAGKFLKKFLFVAQATEIVSSLRYTFKCNQSDNWQNISVMYRFYII